MKKLNAIMTQEQKQNLQEKLVKLVNEKKSGHQIADELGVNYTTVHRWLRKLGLNLPNYHNQLKFDNTVFDNIDTEEKAYWFGFLCADGYVSPDRVTVELSLKGDDIGHLEKFRAFLKNKNSVKVGKSKCNGKEFSRCRMVLTNKHFHDTLISKGCIPQKSLTLEFPDTSIFSSSSLVRHFIRGYFDGDGCITSDNCSKIATSLNGTEEFLTKIIEYYPHLFTTLHLNNKNHADVNAYVIRNCGLNATEFCHNLYDGASVYLQRKFDRFNELKRS